MVGSIRKFVIGACLSVALIAPAMAEEHFDWDGFFAGIGAGANFVDLDRYNNLPAAPNVGSTYSDTVFTAGAIAGYNWQSGNWVYGIEGDVYFTDIDFFGTNVAAMYYMASSDWNASIRGRLGYIIGHHLAYLTAGLGFADINVSQFNGYISDSASDILTGYIIGLGLDFWLNQNILGRVELTHADYGDETFFQGSPLGSFNVELVETVFKVAILFNLSRMSGSR